MTTSKALYLRGMPDELVREAKALAARQGITLTRFVEAALRATIEHVPRSGQLQALEADMRWYEETKPKLLKKHAGEYLAIVGARVVDNDTQFARLARRIASRYGTKPVFMPRCQVEERVVRLPSPRIAG